MRSGSDAQLAWLPVMAELLDGSCLKEAEEHYCSEQQCQNPQRSSEGLGYDRQEGWQPVGLKISR